jgi:hypothetical protein
LSVVLLGSAAASAAPVTGAARDALAGGWREASCGATGGDAAMSFSLEFALTGGQMAVDNTYESAGPHRVTAIDAAGDTLRLTLDGKDVWIFRRTRPDTLVSVTPASDYDNMKGLTFKRCSKPADRSTIHLNAKQTAAISAEMPGGPTLIDLRAAKGCAATEYQYLDFDLVGPLDFKLHRWNSMALAEKIADGGKSSLKIDEIADFIIEKADAIPGGTRFSITELIPPNGSRGDTTTITLKLNPDHTASIPEWKRSYALCTAPK